MIDKGINVKKIDLSGVSFPTNDASTCALIYTAVRNTYGFPLYLTNFEINDEKRDSVLVSPIILTDSVVVNLGDYYLTISATAITATAGVNLVGATIDSDGDVEIGKNLEVDGTIKSMEKIVDADGNARFVEFDGITESVEGVTITYNKASLSGSHLMIVLAGSVEGNTTVAFDQTLARYNLPDYIMRKIIPLQSSSHNIELKDVIAYGPYWNTQVFKCGLTKYTDSQLVIYKLDELTLTETRSFRIQFDLLIDAD